MSATTKRTAHSHYLNWKDQETFPQGEMCQDKVLVRPDKVHSTLEIPDSPNHRPKSGEVLRVGPGRYTKKNKFIPSTVKPGDQILFGPQAVTEVFLKDDYLLIMKEENIFGIVD